MSLKKKRGNIKRQLTNFQSILNPISDDTDLLILDLDARLTKHNDLWNSSDKIQNQIEELQMDETDNQNHETERTTFENRYYSISGLAKKYIQKRSELSSNSIQSTSTDYRLPNSVQDLITAHNNSNHEDNSCLERELTQSSLQGIYRSPRAEDNATNQGVGQFPNQLSSHFQLPRLPTPIFHGTFDA